jgi:hypothetical protein
MIQMRVLGLQTSHLLLIRTNLGYGTVLTVACHCQGCSASGLLWFGFFYILLSHFLLFQNQMTFTMPKILKYLI